MESLLLLALLALLPLLPPLLIFAVVRHGPFPNRWWRGERAWGFATLILVASAVAGFVGALVVWPGSNLGPPVGVLYCAPAGAALGLAWGLARARRRDASAASANRPNRRLHGP